MKTLKVRKKGCALHKEQFNCVWCCPVTGDGPAVSYGQESEQRGILWSVFYWSSDAQGERDEAFFRQLAVTSFLQWIEDNFCHRWLIKSAVAITLMDLLQTRNHWSEVWWPMVALAALTVRWWSLRSWEKGPRQVPGEKVLKATKNVMLLLDTAALPVGNAANHHSLWDSFPVSCNLITF